MKLAGYVWGGERVAMELGSSIASYTKNWGSILASHWVNGDVMLGTSERVARNYAIYRRVGILGELAGT